MFRWKPTKARIISNVIICLVLIVISILVIINRQYIVDQISVWEFHSTSELDSLVNRAGMNSYGKFLYLASHPLLDATQNFNSECNRIENTESILGCYTNSRIYIYDVTDSKLDGIREVTAAHEVLHSAYQRLDDKEKSKINLLLEAEYKKLENNKDFSDRMAFYARTEPGERDNEPHSVIGTEIANISPDLEVYYSKYFSDRQKVVALNTKYSSVFIGLKARANNLASQINALSASINTKIADYNISVNTLNNDITNFNSQATNGSFVSQSQFNSKRADLSNRVTGLEATRSEINADIAKYNSILTEYNSIASESKKLYNSIDSTLAPAPSV